MHPAPVALARISHVVLLLLILAAFASAQENNVRPLIVQAVDDSQLTTLRGNTHPLARAQFDRGAAPPDLPMQRMLLVLKRSDEQTNGLRLSNSGGSSARRIRIFRPSHLGCKRTAFRLGR